MIAPIMLADAAWRIGIVPQGQTIPLTWQMLGGEKTIKGCNMGSNRFRLDMPMLIELYMQGRLKLDEMITRRGPIDDINEMFDAMRRGEATRQVICF